MQTNLQNEDAQPGNQAGENNLPAPDVDENGRPTRAQRKKDGKKGLLFAIYLEYYENSRSNELKLEVYKNLYWDEILDIREKVATIGIMHPLSPGQWKLILPINIDSFRIERQNNYFEYK